VLLPQWKSGEDDEQGYLAKSLLFLLCGELVDLLRWREASVVVTNMGTAGG
jgi:hypothetical protein